MAGLVNWAIYHLHEHIDFLLQEVRRGKPGGKLTADKEGKVK